MNDKLRKKSPRAPSIDLEHAIEGAVRVYEKERRHPAPVEAVAQHLGYKSANNGAAVKAMASIRYFGLFDRPVEGMLAVSKDVESYQFAPSAFIKHELLKKWLKTPQVFSDLLEKYQDGLPSAANLKFEFIKRGFLPDAVDNAVSVFRNSVEFAHYFDSTKHDDETSVDAQAADGARPVQSAEVDQQGTKNASSSNDRIPIRLRGNRRAWLEIPSPFYEADKERLKRQIDLLLTEEDERVE